MVKTWMLSGYPGCPVTWGQPVYDRILGNDEETSAITVSRRDIDANVWHSTLRVSLF
jgi:hypothetical protein